MTPGFFGFWKHKTSPKKGGCFQRMGWNEKLFRTLETPEESPRDWPNIALPWMVAKGNCAEEDAFWIFFWVHEKRQKQQAKIPGILKSVFSSFDPSFRQFLWFSFTEFHQQPGICASISSFTVVFSTSSSPKVLNHSAESAWFNSAASNLVLVANMASAPTPAKPRPKHQVKQQQFISQEEVNISKKYCRSSSKTASNKQLTPPFLKKNTRDVGDFWLLTNILRFRRSGGLST